MTVWTPQQSEAIDAVGRWLRDRDRPYFYLGGYAGTGKTTLARHLADQVDGRVLFAAPTGKSAQVMRRKGCEDATTIHRVIYNVRGRSRERLKWLEREVERLRAAGDHANLAIFEKKLAEERRAVDQPAFDRREAIMLKDAALLVVDECSMIDDRVAEDALSFRVPILALGDPAQLPPVRGCGYFTRRRPDYVLTDVRRQALDNPVLALATQVRQGDDLRLGSYGASRVIPYRDMTQEDATGADVILTGKNVTRRRFNRRMRELAGRTSDYPQRGDRLIALNNRHDLGIYNGSLLVATQDALIQHPDLVVGVEGDDVPEICVTSPCEAFDRYHDPDVRDDRTYWEKRDLVSLDYAYALTVHKAQGSQWDSVLVVDDGLQVGGQDGRRAWLYTAITRAVDKVVVAVR